MHPPGMYLNGFIANVFFITCKSVMHLSKKQNEGVHINCCDIRNCKKIFKNRQYFIYEAIKCLDRLSKINLDKQ